MSVFGPLPSLTAPEREINAHVRKWLPWYLREVERQEQWPASIALPKAWARTNLLSSLPGDDATPMVIVFVRGATEIRRKARGVHDATCALGLAAVVGSSDPSASRDLAGMYGTALTSLLLQRPALDGRMGGKLRIVSWDGIRLDDLDRTAERTLGMVRLEFSFELKDIVVSMAGPSEMTEPPADPAQPAPAWPTVDPEKVQVTIERRDEL